MIYGPAARLPACPPAQAPLLWSLTQDRAFVAPGALRFSFREEFSQDTVICGDFPSPLCPVLGWAEPRGTGEGAPGFLTVGGDAYQLWQALGCWPVGIPHCAPFFFLKDFIYF